MTARRPPPTAFTLIEMLIVLTIMSIMAAALIPSATPTVRDQLQGTAPVVAVDVRYARSLAGANDSSLLLPFDIANESYTVTHAGANTALNTLPDSPFRSPSDPANQQIVRLADLPQMSGRAAEVLAA